MSITWCHLSVTDNRVVMRDNNIHEIIGKYLANDISDNEVLIFNEWVNLCDENLEEFKLHKKTWEETRILYPTLGSELVFRDVLNKIDDYSEAEFAAIPKDTSKTKGKYYSPFKNSSQLTHYSYLCLPATYKFPRFNC